MGRCTRDRSVVAWRAARSRFARDRPPTAMRRSRSTASNSLRLFRSILSNAVDAAPEATDITSRVECLPTADGAVGSRTVARQFRPEMLPRVFELFLSTKPGGTGVGLALAQRIVEEHEERLRSRAPREAGTTVLVSLASRPSYRIAAVIMFASWLNLRSPCSARMLVTLPGTREGSRLTSPH